MLAAVRYNLPLSGKGYGPTFSFLAQVEEIRTIHPGVSEEVAEKALELCLNRLMLILALLPQ